jgi:D-proline reductase (dithiol) PrdB
MTKTVDSFRFLDGLTHRVVKSWIDMEQPREIPWKPLAKPLAQSRVALISSGGIALKDDKPFDQEGERRNPWWGDPSYRVIHSTASAPDIKVYHLHVNSSFAEQDLNCLLPIERMQELATCGEIGSLAQSHYSFMGYILQPNQLLQESTPAIICHLQAEAVDIVILVPA